MNRISLAIFLVFLCLQGIPLLQQWGESIFPSPAHPVQPIAFVVNEKVQPPRRYLEVKPETNGRKAVPIGSLVERRIHPDGSVTLSSPVPPLVAYVTGIPMDWDQVTERDLRLIPGISASMARRLIRLRDTRQISTFGDLRHLPHIGGKSIQKLKAYCVIPHES